MSQPMAALRASVTTKNAFWKVFEGGAQSLDAWTEDCRGAFHSGSVILGWVVGSSVLMAAYDSARG